jgi:GR25 family glycosyltransferase involved in LPS biosynthesis
MTEFPATRCTPRLLRLYTSTDMYGSGMPNDGQIGCWRAHMNIWREMIRTGISSALILEDDVDWDVRIVE